LDTTGEKKKRTSKKNLGGRSTSSHDNKKFRTRSMEKQGEMAFGRMVLNLAAFCK